MKKKVVSLLLFLSGQAMALADTMKQTNAPVSKGPSNPMDTIAILVGAVALSGLIIYLIYIRVADNGFWFKRRKETHSGKS